MAKFKLALMTKSKVSSEMLAKWLGEFKGTSEELLESLEFLSKIQFDSNGTDSLRAVLERMILRSTANACLIVEKLKLLPLVQAQFVPLLSSETDSIRLVALSAFKSNEIPSDVPSKLISAFNGMKPTISLSLSNTILVKGATLKVKISLAEAIAQCSDLAEVKELAKAVVAKESNEQIDDFLLPFACDEATSYSQFKTAKLPLKSVLVKHMPELILKEYASQLFDLVQKEATNLSNAESAFFACASLAKLSSFNSFDWSKFIKEADSKPNSFFRQLASFSPACQMHAIDWLIPNGGHEAVAKCLAQLAITGPALTRKYLNQKLFKLSSHSINIEVIASLLEESPSSWKFCKSLVKTEEDALVLFNPCHELGHDWICLASRVSKNLAELTSSHFDELFNPLKASVPAVKTLYQLAHEPMTRAVKDFLSATLGNCKVCKDEEAIWAHKDESSLAIALPKPTGSQKPDPKTEAALLQKALATEKATREQIRSNMVSLKAAIPLAAHSRSCEEFGPRAVKLLPSPIYAAEASKLLYGLGKAWRPLVATCLIRHYYGDASPFIDTNWNIASLTSMEESIKRLFLQTKPLEPALLYFVPILTVWLHNEQYDFIRQVADRLEELSAIDELCLMKANRLELVRALLHFESRTPDVDRIMSLIGGPMSEEEVSLFLEALFSETMQHRRTALEALHSSWTLSAPQTSHFTLVIDLLRYDDACMHVATAVSLKLRDTPDAPAREEASEMQDLCKLFENKPSDSWVIEAAKETVSSISATTAIKALAENYSRLLKERRPEVVNVRSKDLDLTKSSRAAIVEAFGMVTVPEGNPEPVLDFFKQMVTEYFFDPAKECQENALQSALALLESIPGERMELQYGNPLGNLFEAFLAGKLAVAASRASEITELDKDRARVFVIILLGKVSHFMSHDESRRKSLVKTMLETLKTPAENVQCAVAEALVLLFTRNDDLSSLVTPLKATLVQTDVNMATRRGAAYGLAALTKARGLVSVLEWDLMSLFLHPLRSSVPKSEGKPSTEAKEGALFGLELVARFLGQAFEPYVMLTIDAILTGFSDGRAEVREATFDAARSLIGCVSSAGARLLLPALLTRASMDESNWRSRVGVLEWLGAMASMAPGVLAARLPDIIPILIETGLNDSHGQVQAAARKSLIEYGKAVANPEMRTLVPYILEALADPSASTVSCFRRILETRFAHVIDGPSLALLEPLLRRALIDRSAGAATLKKLAGQIIGNLATSLVDAADFGPYLGTLVPALCGCLGDPVPQVRAHAAKVIGMLVRVAELDGRPASLAVVSGLFPKLEDQLTSSQVDSTGASDIDRAGAAQALAEIMAAKGIRFTTSILEDKFGPFMAPSHSEYRKKEAALLVLGYLSAAFDFYDRLEGLYQETPLPRLLTMVLDLTADNVESVRECASKTSKSLVEQLVGAGIDGPGIFARLLEGFGSPKWRVRLACLGMLEKAMTTYDQDDGDTDEADNVVKVARLPTAEELEATAILSRAQIHVLQTRLYLARFDPASSQLRSTALNLWKALSYHSPRTLTDILPLLVAEVAKPDAIDECSEQVHRALDDLFVKLGDRLAIPFIKEALSLYANDQDACKASILNNLCTLVICMGQIPDMLTRNNFDEANRQIVGAIMLGLSEEDDETAQKYASKLFDELLSRVLTTPEQSGPVIKQIMASESFSTDALLMLVDLKPLQMLSIVIPTIVEALPQSEEQLVLLGEVFETAGHSAVGHAIPVLKTLIQKYADFNSAELEDTLRSILASLNEDSYGDEDEYDGDYDDYDDEGDGQDTVYHLRLGQLMEGQMETSVPWAFLLVRLYCEGSPSLDHSRLYSVWVPRLLMACFLGQAETRVDAQQAKESLLALLAAPKTQHLSSLIQVMRAPASRLEKSTSKLSSLSAWHTPLLTLLTKAIFLPILTGASVVSSDTETMRSHACEVATCLLRVSSTASASVSWGTSALTLLVGALIRVGSDRKAGESRAAAFETLLEAIKTHPAALRPFYPQLQRLFAQAITAPQAESQPEAHEVEPAIQSLARLIPLLPKPEAIVQEWAAILAVSEDGDESTDNIQRVPSAAKTSMLRCLTILFQSSSQIASKIESLKEPITELVKMLAAHEDESVRLQNTHFIEALATSGLFSPAERTKLLDLATMLK